MKRYYYWNKNKQKYNDVYQFICQCNGVSITEIAKRFNTRYGVVVRWLTSFDSLGFLLYQDGSKVFKFDSELL